VWKSWRPADLKEAGYGGNLRPPAPPPRGGRLSGLGLRRYV